MRRRLGEVATPAGIAAESDTLAGEIRALAKHAALTAEEAGWLHRLAEAIPASSAVALLGRCRRLAERADDLARGMDFRFLYKPDRHLFAVGFNVPAAHLDSGSYDLLASEARLASFLAIARGDAPRKHWFHLGRMLVAVEQRLCLVSWGGTMFEYLMPELLLRRYPETLLMESCETAVARQIAYGQERGVPWGISESAFSSQYINLDYQYQAFGVPGLGLKRGLADDLVVAPYATALATMVRPHAALQNFRRLAAEGADGRFGFYEAIDYTPQPAARGEAVAGGALLHGAPPGDESVGAGELPDAQCDAAPLPCRARRVRDGAAVAGARAGRRRAGAAARAARHAERRDRRGVEHAEPAAHDAVYRRAAHPSDCRTGSTA